MSFLPFLNKKNSNSANSDSLKSDITNQDIWEKKEFLQKIFNEIPDAIIVTRLSDGKIVEVNKYWTEIFGYSRAESIGNSVIDLNVYFDPKDRDKIIERLKKSQSVYKIELPFRQRGGNVGTAQLSVERIEVSGKLYAVSVIHDVTQSIQKDKELSLVHNFFQDILNSIADPVFVKNEKHSFEVLNNAFCKFIGHPREDLIGKSDYDFFPKTEADVFWKKDEEVYQTGQENINEEKITDRKGVVHIISTKKTLYQDAEKHKFIVGIIQDISTGKKLETLHKIQRDLAMTLSCQGDLNNILKKMLEIIIGIDGIDCGGVYYENKITGNYDLVSHQGLSERFVEEVKSYKTDSPNIQFAKKGIPLYLTYSELIKQENIPEINREGLRALAILPIMQNEKLLAILNVASHTGDSIFEEVRSLLENIAAQIVDVIFRIQIEEKLKKSEEYYRMLIENSTDNVAQIRQDGTIIYDSPSLESMLGYKPEEVIGKSGFEYIHPDDLSNVTNIFKQGFSNPGRIYKVQFRFRHKNGEYRVMEGTGKVIDSSDDLGQVVLLTSRDITERITIENQIKDRNLELEKLNKLMVGREVRMSELKTENEALKKAVKY
jgi:PAS domain S-box-containing protein